MEIYASEGKTEAKGWGHKLINSLLVCGGGETKSPCKSYAAKKKTLKKKRLGHQMMHGKAIWKIGIGVIAKASRGIAPWTPQGELTTAPNMDHKTQSFMKNRGQQKCLDKTLRAKSDFTF